MSVGLSFQRVRGPATAALAAVVAVLASCRHAAPPAAGPPPVIAQPQQISLPPEHPVMTSPQLGLAGSDTAAETHVDIDTHGAEVDVRQVLAFLADKGKLSLVFSPEVNRKVRVQLHDVPVSQALAAVLASAGLTLESTTGTPAPGPTSSVVFYQLPVNVDSLSVDAIVKRFGVSRSMAEIIVQSRSGKP